MNFKNRLKKITKVSSAVVISSLLFAGCATNTTQSENNLPTIVTTFYPTSDIVNAIAENTVQVKTLIPIGAEPHSFEPTAKQIVELSKADAFVTMEGMFESIEDKLIDANSELKVINAAHGFEHEGHEDGEHKDEHEEHHEDEHKHEDEHHDDENEHENEHHDDENEHENEHHDDEHKHEDEHHDDEHEHENEHHDDEHEHEKEHHEDEHEDEHDHHDHHGHDHGDFDPHVWLSLHNMEDMTKEITEQLIEIYPQNKEMYELNKVKYLTKLEMLENKYKNELSTCKQNTILVNHKAFGYLANDYGFEQISVAGFSPESEPSPKTIQNVVNKAKELNLKFIYSEGQLDKKTAQTLATEIGGEVLELNPILTTEKNYFELMENNLKALKKGLECNE